MKELTINEVKEISGGLHPVVAGFITMGVGYYAGEVIFKPLDQAVDRGINSFIKGLDEMGRRHAEQYMRDPEGYARDHFSFYGDMPHSWR